MREAPGEVGLPRARFASSRRGLERDWPRARSTFVVQQLPQARVASSRRACSRSAQSKVDLERGPRARSVSGEVCWSPGRPRRGGPSPVGPARARGVPSDRAGPARAGRGRPCAPALSNGRLERARPSGSRLKRGGSGRRHRGGASNEASLGMATSG